MPELTPADLANNEGSRLFDLGRYAEGSAKFREAMEMDPKHPHAQTNLVFSADYGPELGWEEHQALRKDFAASLDTRLHYRLENDLSVTKKIKVGYISPDFRNHSALACFGPVLQSHDHSRFEVICYSDTDKPDEATERVKGYADTFRETRALSDSDLADLIRSDGIDILVDLAGYSAYNRLRTFALKPAPIQITAWGHGGGTGLPQVDYHFADQVSIPANVRHLFAEKVWDLSCIIPFEVPEFNLPIHRPPVAENGYITFGSLGKRCKVNDRMIRIWAVVLGLRPKSRLLLKDGPWENPEVAEPIFDILEGYGISSHRIITRGRTSKLQHCQSYADVDFVLDTWPQNGGVSTLEALWHGAPVLTQLGSQLSSRVSAAILVSLGLERFICPTSEPFAQFVDRTVANEDLMAFRRTIREIILNSRIGNRLLYTQDVENAYRKMWGIYVASRV